MTNQGENPDSLRIRTATPDQALLERDADVFYHQMLSTPVLNSVSKVEGAYIYDGAGKKFLDFHGNGVHTVGYNNPYVIKALQDQIVSGLTFAPRRFTNDPAVKLAEKMVVIAPNGLSRVLLCPGGSEAIEMAVMLSKQHTGKWKTISFEGTFHGAGFQAVSIGADPHFRKGLGPLIPGALHLPLPDYYRNPWGYTDQLRIDNAYIRQFEELVEKQRDIAALVTEPIFFNSVVPSAYYWQSIKEICENHGILLIFDEIYTAFGRTGKMFASEHFVTPDLLVVGKGFGGAVLPFAGIIGKEKFNTLQHRSIGHYTHEKGPFCSAAASAVIDYILDHDLVDQTEVKGTYMLEGLQALKEQFSIIGDVRGLGLNLAVELVKDQRTRERATEEAHWLMRFCLERGISFKLIQGNVLNLKPALIITKDEIDRTLSVLKEGFEYISSMSL